jgi:hypothetical protein
VNISKSAQQTNPVVVEFWTHDGGQTVYGNNLGTFS